MYRRLLVSIVSLLVTLASKHTMHRHSMHISLHSPLHISLHIPLHSHNILHIAIIAILLLIVAIALIVTRVMKIISHLVSIYITEDLILTYTSFLTDSKDIIKILTRNASHKMNFYYFKKQLKGQQSI